MNDYGKLWVVRGETILVKDYNSKGTLSESLLKRICYIFWCQVATLPTVHIEPSLISTQYFSLFGIKPMGRQQNILNGQGLKVNTAAHA